MGKPTGFKEFERQAVPYRDPLERAQDFLEIYTEPVETQLRTQGARCMDCGVPFCQSSSGCPIDNLIPEWNDLIYQGRWRDALAPAAQLNKVGHLVTVYERADRIGGLLMYGIPNMKLDKGVVQRRIDPVAVEGGEILTYPHIG